MEAEQAALQGNPPIYIFQGSKLLKNDGLEKLDTTFFLDRHTNQIELIDEDWNVTVGSYEIEGDTLRISFSSTQPWPTSSESKPGTKTQLSFERTGEEAGSGE